jgi:NADH-quinone oxidoreductase subunit B
VDVYVNGCPPRPEALIYALMKLQEKIRDPESAKRPMYSGVDRDRPTKGWMAKGEEIPERVAEFEALGHTVQSGQILKG